MRNIGLWINHGPQCRGLWYDPPTTLVRMTYTVLEPVAGCKSGFRAENTALSSFQNAQLTVTFNVVGYGSANLSLSLGGTSPSPPWMPAVTVDGATISFTGGVYSAAISTGSHTLNFALNPSATGTAAAGTFYLEGGIL